MAEGPSSQEDCHYEAVKPAYQHPLISTPDKFDFDEPDLWSKWSVRWKRYRDTSGLMNEPDNLQINSLLYMLGERAEDIIVSLKIPEDTHDNVLTALDKYFEARTNTISERAKFNRITQGDVSFFTFVKDLLIAADRCDYGAMKNDLIRDRIVVGCADEELSEKLQSIRDLTLQTAIKIGMHYYDTPPLKRAEVKHELKERSFHRGSLLKYREEKRRSLIEHEEASQERDSFIEFQRLEDEIESPDDSYSAAEESVSLTTTITDLQIRN